MILPIWDTQLRIVLVHGYYTTVRPASKSFIAPCHGLYHILWRFVTKPLLHPWLRTYSEDPGDVARVGSFVTLS